MPITVSGTSITFNDATTQTTAFTGGGVTSLNGQTGAITNTDLGSIGSYAILGNAQNANLSMGDTRAGSSLRYNVNYTTQVNQTLYMFSPVVQRQDNSNYPGGGTSLSGTWRKLMDTTVYRQFDACEGTAYLWAPCLYVRIS
jgi:hypothetical protein